MKVKAAKAFLSDYYVGVYLDTCCKKMALAIQKEALQVSDETGSFGFYYDQGKTDLEEYTEQSEPNFFEIYFCPFCATPIERG